MMYPFLTLEDETQLVHSGMLGDGTVKVYIETPDAECGFRHAECILPQYEWRNIYHYSESEIASLEELIRSVAHLIMEFSQEGGFEGQGSKIEDGMKDASNL